MNRSVAIILVILVFVSCNKSSDTSELLIKHDHVVKTEKGRLLDSLLTPYIEELRELTDNQAGLAIGITDGNQMLYGKTFGFANIAQKIPVDFNTRFHIASVSKPFTAVAIMTLVENGKLNLSDKLSTYLEDFEMQSPEYDKITIEQVLTHTSGIPRHISADDWLTPVSGAGALAGNLSNVRSHSLDFDPGAEYSYSNSAFDILGLVVEAVSGLTFPEYVKQHVLIPAGMLQSEYELPKELSRDWALPYSYGIETQDWSPYPYTGLYHPSSGVQSSLNDMCRWARIHLGKGQDQDFKVLARTTFEELIKPRQETPWGEQIALSWFLQTYMDRPNIMHLGYDTGFEANLYIFPEDDIAIVVMANRDFSRVGRITLAASEIIFGQAPKDYDVSARFKFGETYREKGAKAAFDEWELMRLDTLDRFSVDDGDILTAGAVLENDQQWTESMDLLKYYLKTDSQSTYAWRLLGNTWLGKGDTVEAISCYQKCLTINPEYERAQKALQKLIAKN